MLSKDQMYKKLVQAAMEVCNRVVKENALSMEAKHAIAKHVTGENADGVKHDQLDGGVHVTNSEEISEECGLGREEHSIEFTCAQEEEKLQVASLWIHWRGDLLYASDLYDPFTECGAYLKTTEANEVCVCDISEPVEFPGQGCIGVEHYNVVPEVDAEHFFEAIGMYTM